MLIGLVTSYGINVLTSYPYSSCLCRYYRYIHLIHLPGPGDRIGPLYPRVGGGDRIGPLYPRAGGGYRIGPLYPRAGGGDRIGPLYPRAGGIE